MSTSPAQTLIAYSRQQATMEEVMRALVSYDGWLAVASYAVHATQEEKFPGVLMLSQECNIPAGELWFFTDEASAMTATNQGAQLGTYIRGVPGTKLFAALPMNYKSVHINPGCETAKTWQIQQGAFAITALWAHAIALESWLTKPESPEKLAAMRDYPGYLYLVNPEHDAIVTGPGMDGMRNPALLFTAGDCLQAVTAAHPHLQQRWADGGKLFSFLRSQGGDPAKGIDGIVFNPLGPGPKAAFDLSICDRVSA